MTPSAPFTIRPAEPGDEDALAALDRNGWSALHMVQPRPQPPYEPFFDPGHPPAQFLVAELAEGAVVGYIRMVPSTPLPTNAHVRQIQGLLVGEAARGRGIARALLDAACDWAREQGVLRLTLRVLAHNGPARGLYAAAGFEVEGVLPGEFRIEGAYVDDVLMGRWLTR